MFSLNVRTLGGHLSQGTRPSKKLTNIRDVKRYLKVASVSCNGLLDVKRTDPFHSHRECIIVTRHVLEGCFMQLDPPSPHQLKKVARRYPFALDLEKVIDTISANCHPCASLRKASRTIVEQIPLTHPTVFESLLLRTYLGGTVS